MSDSEEEEVFAGLSLPPLNPTSHAAEPSDDDEEESGARAPLLSASAAFEGAGADAMDLDPFRAAAGLEPAPHAPPSAAAAAPHKQKFVPKGHISQRKLFIGGLPFSSTDASLTKFFSRFGKVQEAVAVTSESGKPRGFGFVTFVSDKGARYCIEQAGDPPVLQIEGRDCTVRPVQEREDRGQGHYLMPARGTQVYLGEPKEKKERREAREAARERPADLSGGAMPALGVASIAMAHKRGYAAEEEEVDEQPGEPRKRNRKKKEEIVTVTRRQDAEPLNKRPITMKEIFPKEFWRV
ncbi:hypothetical protein AB1Y20_012646 [Prymnesium parvum]|uniref:RRM domain-containing protein n=1 Tax=Prymnesium parvum TaxID=97485 RepID=A0AB34ILA4_PRYPA